MKRLDYDRDCKYSFGEYVIAGTQNDNNTENVMTEIEELIVYYLQLAT